MIGTVANSSLRGAHRSAGHEMLTTAGFGANWPSGRATVIEAEQSAESAKKPVVVYVTAAWDAACQEQNRSALKDPKVMAALEPFTRLKLDVTNKGATELMLMSIDKLPTFTFSNHEGRPVVRLIGTQNPDALVEAAKKATAP